MKHEVTAHIDIVINIEGAEDKNEAIKKAKQMLESLNGILKTDSFDVKEIED